MTLDRIQFTTPFGPLVAFAHGRTLCALAFADHEDSLLSDLTRRFGQVSLRRDSDTAGVRKAFAAYAKGDTAALDSLEVDTGGTPFQQSVWRALREIPAGTTMSYAGLARAIGRPAAVRAVGAANGANPVAIVIPCHRVIASDGSLHGYGGGLDRKRWLLDHEHRHARVASVV